MDVTSLRGCQSVLNKHHPTVIVNTAAVTDVDECEQDNKLCLSVNTKSVLNYIPYVKKNDIHFIHISTDFVFNGQKGEYTEQDICDPINFYGFSKLESEKNILNEHFKSTILRTSLVYGKDDENTSNFFNKIKDKLEGNMQLSIVDDQYRTPTFVNDLSDAILKVIQKQQYGLYHISSGEILSIYQIVCNIAKCCGFDSKLVKRIKSEQLNQIAVRPLDSSLSIDKAIRELDFDPTTLNNALKELL
jgi:dTDP-4-dehydrorhamnose reductase